MTAPPFTAIARHEPAMKTLPLYTLTPPREIPRDVALLHADGKLPNFALMRLSTYFRERGANVRLVRPGDRRAAMFGDHPVCFGSSIFDFSTLARARLEREWAPIHWGGVGVRENSSLNEIDSTVDWDAVRPDYSLYPGYSFSLGYSQRGCRMSCDFCKVPREEGRARSVARIDAIWRGDPYPRKIVLLDNDFFGVPEWRDNIQAIRDGGFEVSFSQGINIRLVDEAAARELATVKYRDNEFREPVLYTAWDSLRDEARFIRGVWQLEDAGIPAKNLRVYMVVGFAQGETWDDIQRRYWIMRNLGCEPYPMVYDNCAHPPGLVANRTLKHFQRWAIRLARSGKIRWDDYDPHAKAGRTDVGPSLFDDMEEAA